MSSLDQGPHKQMQEETVSLSWINFYSITLATPELYYSFKLQWHTDSKENLRSIFLYNLHFPVS